jgi:serine/threonine protein kinase
MGVVYRARDERLERDVAIKVLPPGVLHDEAARRRFRTEALALAKLSHPNIATVYDVGVQGGGSGGGAAIGLSANVDYLVMELVPGQSLSQKLKTGPLPTLKR